MNQEIYQEYISILKEELVPAMGCTEPISIAYCAALAKKTLGRLPSEVKVYASNNIIKNVKSVIVPSTGGLYGIPSAVAAGLLFGDSDKQLQVLSNIKEEDIPQIKEYLLSHEIQVDVSPKPYIFDIEIILKDNGDIVRCEIAGNHTNVISLSKNDQCLIEEYYEEKESLYKSNHNLLNVKDICLFAKEVNIEDIRFIIERQIQYNSAIAKEGLTNSYGSCIGKTILTCFENNSHNKAKAYAAAGSDARMGGCQLPVIINSGSGNQGLTASLPVIIYAEDLHVSHETLLRALVISNLITLHLKRFIGCLSAYCGATSAGVGSAAGITYLYGGSEKEISKTIINALSIDSGMICDGAKSSCAAKIASAVEAGILGFQMQRNQHTFHSGEGLVSEDVEHTIRNFGRLAHDGMKETDKTIIDMMIKCN